MRIGFALITTQLLGIIGLLFAGGILLLWVCWKMWREMREQATHEEAEAAACRTATRRAADPQGQDLQGRPSFTILVADLSMSDRQCPRRRRRGARAPGRSWCSA
jgi:predicted tellurium resistance membrane protein TerC